MHFAVQRGAVAVAVAGAAVAEEAEAAEAEAVPQGLRPQQRLAEESSVAGAAGGRVDRRRRTAVGRTCGAVDVEYLWW